jgi:hypothetical protein
MNSLQEKFDEIFGRKFMEIDYPDDCNMIIDVLKKELDVVLKPFQAQEIWRWYSDSYFCAGWLQLVSEEEILKAFCRWMQDHDPEHHSIDSTLDGVDDSDI